MVDLLLDAEQEQVVAGFADLLAGDPPFDALRRGEPTAFSDRWIAALGEMGWIGVGAPAEAGGTGLSAVEEALLMREAGRSLLTPAYLASVLAAHAAARPVAAAIIGGSQRVGLGVRVGSSLLVFEGVAGAPVFVGEAGDPVLLTDGGPPHLAPKALDETLSVWSIAAPRASNLPQTALGRRTTLLAAAYLVGIADGARDMAVAYAKVREQFGQPIGAFQAVKHSCADMAVRSEAAYSQLIFAVLSMQEQRSDTDFQVSAAKILAGEAALGNSEANIQVHGGMGFSAESGAHLYLKRAHLMNVVGGSQRRHSARILELSPLG